MQEPRPRGDGINMRFGRRRRYSEGGFNFKEIPVLEETAYGAYHPGPQPQGIRPDGKLPGIIHNHPLLLPESIISVLKNGTASEKIPQARRAKPEE
jgi:hypothetical protein